VSVSTRTPTISFLRPRNCEPGAKFAICWNGTRAENGDGNPGGELGAIDYATWLSGSFAIPLWRKGHLSMFGGAPFVGGVFEPHAEADPALGYGSGRYGEGLYAVGNPWTSWKFQFQLRDGIYRVAIVTVDRWGNAQAAGDEVVQFEVAALPRPPRNAIASYSEGTLTVSWDASPEWE
jgi:hypothetical protein